MESNEVTRSRGGRGGEGAPGLLESVYEAVLARALDKRGFQVERQQAIRFEYDGMVFEEGFRTCTGPQQSSGCIALSTGPRPRLRASA